MILFNAKGWMSDSLYFYLIVDERGLVLTACYAALDLMRVCPWEESAVSCE